MVAKVEGLTIAVIEVLDEALLQVCWGPFN